MSSYNMNVNLTETVIKHIIHRVSLTRKMRAGGKLASEKNIVDTPTQV